MSGSEHGSEKIHPALNTELKTPPVHSRRNDYNVNSAPISYAREIAEIPPSQHKCYECYRSCCGDFVGCLGLICSCCNCSPYVTVPQGQVGIQQRFGKAYRVLDPGLYYVNPLCEQMAYVGMMMSYLKVPKQIVTTKDNVAITISSVVYWQIIDPFVAAFHIANIETAIKQRTMSTLRDTVGVYSLQDVIENRKALSKSIKKIIEKTATSWGIRIESILINELVFSDQLQSDLSATAKQIRLGQSKVIIAKAEVESAKLLRQASDILNTPAAIQIRHLDTMLSMSKSRGAQVIFTPHKVKGKKK